MSREQVSPRQLYRWILTESVRFVLRDYSFDENALEKQRQELQTANISEKELWVGLRPSYCRRHRFTVPRRNSSDYQELISPKPTKG